MIRLKSVYDYKEDVASIKLHHRHSCTAEVLAVIYRLMNEIEEYGDISRKDIYKYLKQMDKEKEDEIEVL